MRQKNEGFSVMGKKRSDGEERAMFVAEASPSAACCRALGTTSVSLSLPGERRLTDKLSCLAAEDPPTPQTERE